MKKVTFFFVLIFFLVQTQAQEYIDYKIRTNRFYAQTDETGFLDVSYADPAWHFRGKVSSSSPSGSWSSYECVYLTNVSTYGAWNQGQWYPAETTERWNGKCLSNADNIYINLEGWEEQNNTPCTYESTKDDYNNYDTDYDTDISGSHTRNTWTGFKNAQQSNVDYVDCGTEGSNGYYKIEFDVWWNYSLPVDPEFSVTDIASSSITINLTNKNNYRITDWEYQVSTNSTFTKIVANATGITNLSTVVSGINVNTTYYIRIRGENEAGTGDWTALQTVSTPIGELTWDGSESTDWHTAANWDGDVVPDKNYNVTIPFGLTNYPTLSTAGECNNLTMASSEASTAALIGQQSLTIDGTTIIEQYLTGNAWHLVSSPVAGQTIASFLSANTNVPTSGNYRGMMDYDELSNDWNTFFLNTGQVGDLSSGKGFSLRTNSDGVVSFTGTMHTGDVNSAVTCTGDYGWNCVGNPYPSAIFINDAADVDNNFIDLNINNLDGSYGAVYVWEETKGDYTIVALDNAEAFYAQVGQGFFVKVKTGATQVQFTTAMQTHQMDAPFKGGIVPIPELKITASMGDTSRTTRLKFNDATTIGLDFGFDAGVFKTGFDIYTKLIEDNGVDFGLQSLPETGIEQYEIPLGIDVESVGEISFILRQENFPVGIIPVLNDSQTGTSFVFNSKEDVYTTTVNAEANGYGRFTLTFLSTTGIGENKVSNFKAWYNDGYIYISGQMNGAGDATIYDINGRKVAVHQLTDSGHNKISVPKGTKGIYLVKVKDSKHSEVLKVPVASR
ncbi:MAG: T9SS type A sorting domain-containing protein [Draconibacterium sp.]